MVGCKCDRAIGASLPVKLSRSPFLRGHFHWSGILTDSCEANILWRRLDRGAEIGAHRALVDGVVADGDLIWGEVSVVIRDIGIVATGHWVVDNGCGTGGVSVSIVDICSIVVVVLLRSSPGDC